MMFERDLEGFMDQENFLSKMFDVIRIVEVGGDNNTCEWIDGKLIPTQQKCYLFWDRNEKCKNCVSQQACKSNQQMIKMEYMNDKCYLVIAKPMMIGDKTCVVEMFTDVTAQMTDGSGDFKDGDFIMNTVSQLERISSRDVFSGVYNKNFMIRNLEEQIGLSKDEKQPVFMGLMDIENFKKDYKDEYSEAYALSDEDVVNIGNAMMNIINITDGVISRFDGYKFCVLFRTKDEQRCRKLMREMISEVKKYIYTVTRYGGDIRIVSGMADVESAADFMEALHMVDKLVYDEKRKSEPYVYMY
jgi:diguanylate cyclase (GGDEF)-like protein